MTERELERQLQSWYRQAAEQAGPTPTSLQASVSSIPDASPYRPAPFGTRRSLVVLAAAALLTALLVGGAIAIGSGLIPWLSDDRDVDPPPVAAADWGRQPWTNAEPGTYFLDLPAVRTPARLPPVRVQFTLPAGWDWERVQVEGFLWGQTVWIGFAVVDNLYIDPCDPGLGRRDPPIGPTAADLAAALPTVAGWQVTATTDVTVDGFSGKHVRLIAPADSSSCFHGETRLLHALGSPGFMPALRDNEPVELWILDVQGTRLVIKSGSEPGRYEGTPAQIQAIIESIEIEP